MAETQGLHHLGLTVNDLDQTTDFFLSALGWTEVSRDPSYPRTMITDGKLLLTLWQVNASLNGPAFDRKANVGLHHVAIEVASNEKLEELGSTLATWPGVTIEFAPEELAGGPKRHMMFAEPGGLRIELIWPATSA